MTTMEKARELGMALANSPEYIRMTKARESVDSNKAVSELLREFQDKERQIVTMLEQDDVDREGAVMLTGDIERIKAQLLSNDLFSELMDSQQAFSDLLGAVNREINACIGIVDPQEDVVTASCNGVCENCKGCAH